MTYCGKLIDTPPPPLRPLYRAYTPINMACQNRSIPAPCIYIIYIILLYIRHSQLFLASYIMIITIIYYKNICAYGQVVVYFVLVPGVCSIVVFAWICYHVHWSAFCPRFCRYHRLQHLVSVSSVQEDVQTQGEPEQPSEARVRRRTAVPVHYVRQTIYVETTPETSSGQRAQVANKHSRREFCSVEESVYPIILLCGRCCVCVCVCVCARVYRCMC